MKERGRRTLIREILNLVQLDMALQAVAEDHAGDEGDEPITKLTRRPRGRDAMSRKPIRRVSQAIRQKRSDLRLERRPSLRPVPPYPL